MSRLIRLKIIFFFCIQEQILSNFKILKNRVWNFCIFHKWKSRTGLTNVSLDLVTFWLVALLSSDKHDVKNIIVTDKSFLNRFLAFLDSFSVNNKETSRFLTSDSAVNRAWEFFY